MGLPERAPPFLFAANDARSGNAQQAIGLRGERPRPERQVIESAAESLRAPPVPLKRFLPRTCDMASPNAFIALHPRARYVSKAAI
ncbi:hypothetical protein V1281_005650 [Nitrobacteraceae bacterium AZCC 2161]